MDFEKSTSSACEEAVTANRSRMTGSKKIFVDCFIIPNTPSPTLHLPVSNPLDKNYYILTDSCKGLLTEIDFAQTRTRKETITEVVKCGVACTDKCENLFFHAHSQVCGFMGRSMSMSGCQSCPQVSRKHGKRTSVWKSNQKSVEFTLDAFRLDYVLASCNHGNE